MTDQRVQYKDEDEGELAHQVLEDYWIKFSMLVAETLAKMPSDLEALTLVRIQEKSSAYGSDYGHYLKSLRTGTTK